MFKMNYGLYEENGLLSMFYSINKSIELIDKEYDVIIRFRGDLLLKNKWELIEFNNELVLPLYGNFGGYNDQIAYGSFKNMKIYSEIINNINYYCINNCLFNPEILLKNHLDKNNITIIRQDIDYDLIWFNGHIHNMKEKETKLGFI